MNCPVISVIIPIYGVENFIERCAETLLTQTLKDGIEYIFVDDASKDLSLHRLNNVIESFPEKKKAITIIRHEHNKGLPAARNSGLEVAKGKYIYHVDGDDFVEPDIFEKMLEAAINNNADFVWSDWYLSYEKTERLMRQQNASSVREAIELILSGRNKYNVWNKLVKRNLYFDNNIRFPEEHPMGEDMTMIRLLSCAKNIAYASGAWYHYVKTNGNAMTINHSTKALSDIIFNVNETTEFLLQSDIEGIQYMTDDFKRSVKYHFLFSSNSSDYHIWQQLWPESNYSISLRNGFHAMCIQTIARLKFWPLLKIHFYMYNFLYRTLYN